MIAYGNGIGVEDGKAELGMDDAPLNERQRQHRQHLGNASVPNGASIWHYDGVRFLLEYQNPQGEFYLCERVATGNGDSMY